MVVAAYASVSPVPDVWPRCCECAHLRVGCLKVLPPVTHVRGHCSTQLGRDPLNLKLPGNWVHLEHMQQHTLAAHAFVERGSNVRVCVPLAAWRTCDFCSWFACLLLLAPVVCRVVKPAAVVELTLGAICMRSPSTPGPAWSARTLRLLLMLMHAVRPCWLLGAAAHLPVSHRHCCCPALQGSGLLPPVTKSEPAHMSLFTCHSPQAGHCCSITRIHSRSPWMH